jgi:tRNA (guanine-N7-)-methyltransferase
MNYPLRSIKSWVSRIGSLSSLQKNMLTQYMNIRFFATGDYELFKQTVLLRSAEKIFLDIGFGDGLTLIALAQQYPDALILGFEPHLSGVAHCLVKIKELGLDNILIFQGDVLDYLEDRTMHKASRVHIYFSDPWPKVRHYKRRLIQVPFLKLLAERLMPGSLIHFATDWQNYAQHITSCFVEQDDFVLTSFEQLPIQDQFKRPVTKYEQRGINLGHTITEFYAYLKS